MKQSVFGTVVFLYEDKVRALMDRVRRYEFHAQALRKEIFYNSRLDSMAALYRADHDEHDLFLEAYNIGKSILYLNSVARQDSAIGEGFLDRVYLFRIDQRTASADELLKHTRDVYQLIDDFSDAFNICVSSDRS